MAMNARHLLLGGLGLVLAAVLWMYADRDVSQEMARIAPESVEGRAERVKDERIDLKPLLTKINHELTLLRSQLTELKQKQEAIVWDIDQMTLAGLEDSTGAPGTEEAAGVALPPEEELEQAEVQTEAQVELLEQTLFTEKIDSGWASSAQLALEEAFGDKEVTGFELVGHECRSTLCRLELNFDGSASPEQSFQNFLQLRPWQGYGFSQVDNEGFAVVYLARDGYSLPQLQ